MFRWHCTNFTSLLTCWSTRLWLPLRLDMFEKVNEFDREISFRIFRSIRKSSFECVSTRSLFRNRSFIYNQRRKISVRRSSRIVENSRFVLLSFDFFIVFYRLSGEISTDFRRIFYERSLNFSCIRCSPDSSSALNINLMCFLLCFCYLTLLLLKL